MPGFDDRLKRHLERLAEPADPTGAFERVMERKVRRRVLRRVETVGLVVFVLAGTIGGTFALTRVFRSNGAVTPGRLPRSSQRSVTTPTPTETTPSPTETTPSPTPTSSPYPPECQASEVTGDFDGDGLPEVAVVARSSCVGNIEGTDFAISLTWSGGSSGSAPLFDCRSACVALDAVDLNADGVDELALLVDRGASTQFAEFYELNVGDAGEAFGRQAVLVAPPGSDGFAPDKPAVFPLGGSVAHLDFLSCFQAEDGTGQLAADAAVLSNDQTKYAVHETVFVLNMTLDVLYGRFVVQSTRDYTVPFDPNGQTDFKLPGPACLAP